MTKNSLLTLQAILAISLMTTGNSLYSLTRSHCVNIKDYQILSKVRCIVYYPAKHDNFYQLAKECRVNVDTIKKLSNALSINNLHNKQCLIIPAKTGIIQIVKGYYLSQYMFQNKTRYARHNKKVNNVSKRKWYVIFTPLQKLVNVDLKLIRPVKHSYIGITQGTRRDPFTGRWVETDHMNYHARLDSSVVSVLAGRVVVSRRINYYGHLVIIQHTNNLRSWYWPIRKPIVQKGMSIKKNQRIGSVGRTGTPGGPSVSFKLLLRDQLVDLKNVFKTTK